MGRMDAFNAWRSGRMGGMACLAGLFVWETGSRYFGTHCGGAKIQGRSIFLLTYFVSMYYVIMSGFFCFALQIVRPRQDIWAGRLYMRVLFRSAFPCRLDLVLFPAPSFWVGEMLKVYTVEFMILSHLLLRIAVLSA